MPFRKMGRGQGVKVLPLEKVEIAFCFVDIHPAFNLRCGQNGRGVALARLARLLG